MATRRSLALVTGVSAVTGAALIPLVSLPLRDRLPDPIATHWSGGGPPDGSGSLTAALLICCGMWATICAGALVLGWSGWGRMGRPHADGRVALRGRRVHGGRTGPHPEREPGPFLLAGRWRHGGGRDRPAAARLRGRMA